MSKREAYQQKAEAKLGEHKANLDKARAQLKGKGADARLDAEKHLDALEKRFEAARSKLEELRKAGGDAWEDLTDGFEKAWDDTSAGFKKFFGRS